MLLFDGHLDIAMNAVEWNRDLTASLDEIRAREQGMTDKKDRGTNVVSLEEMRRGEIGLCIATQVAHYVSPDNPSIGWNSPEIAWAHTQCQLAWYRAMERRGLMRQITHQAELAEQAALWSGDAPPNDAPIGYILSLEGADSILTLDHLQIAYEYGLRAIGPAHYGPGRYAPGTGSEGGLEPAGRELVKEMARLNMALDATHLTDDGFWEALELHDGVVWASHNNCRAIVPHQRQFSDEQLSALIERDAVIGLVMDAWMLHPGWIKGKTTPEGAGLDLRRAVEQIDHICQLAGNARHCGIGSDLDGGYGYEQTPSDVRSIADLQGIAGILAERGYPAEDVTAIMHGNWLRRVSAVLT